MGNWYWVEGGVRTIRTQKSDVWEKASRVARYDGRGSYSDGGTELWLYLLAAVNV